MPNTKLNLVSQFSFSPITKLSNSFIRWYRDVLGDSILQWHVTPNGRERERTNWDVTTQRSGSFHFPGRMGFPEKNFFQWPTMCHASSRWLPKAPQQWPIWFPGDALHNIVLIIVIYSNVLRSFSIGEIPIQGSHI